MCRLDLRQHKNPSYSLYVFIEKTALALFLAAICSTALVCCGQSEVRNEAEILAEGDPEDSIQESDAVETALGPIQGIAYERSSAFLGIPYASPPVGERRFERPSPIEPWENTFKATDYGPPCPQLGREGISEDCLTLNIWTPKLQGDPAPVMVWIHGGGMRTGSSDNPFSVGRFIAEERGIVVVSLNYRLGPFGFLAHPSLGAASGNYGLWDQQAGLKWVQDHIAHFGGDPSNVTLMGESAGSASTCVHLASPLSEGLFHKVIMQSGPCASVGPDGMSPVVPKAEMESQGEALAQLLGCGPEANQAACLRSKSVDDILNGLPLVPGGIVLGEGVNWFPNIDGELIPDLPLSRILDGKVKPLPTIIGSTADEGTVFAAAAELIFVSGNDYIERIEKRFGPLAQQVLAEYPPFAHGLPFHALSKLLGDMVFVCPARQTARALTASFAPTYLYSFDINPSYASVMAFFGAFHASEIPFVFHSLPEPLEFTSSEAAVSLEMVSYWTSFARHGHPNDAANVQWPLHGEEDRHLEIGSHGITVGRHLSRDNCDFWDSIWPQ